jgi:hypothetical protein
MVYLRQKLDSTYIFWNSLVYSEMSSILEGFIFVSENVAIRVCSPLESGVVSGPQQGC